MLLANKFIDISHNCPNGAESVQIFHGSRKSDTGHRKALIDVHLSIWIQIFTFPNNLILHIDSANCHSQIYRGQLIRKGKNRIIDHRKVTTE